MKNTILSNIKQSVSSPYFCIATFAVTILILLSSTESIVLAFRSNNLLMSSYHVTFILNALKNDTIFFFTPIVAALPMSAAFIEDIKSNYVRYYIYRSSRFSYILGRSLGCFISGGCVLMFGILTAYFVAALIFMPLERAIDPQIINPPGLRDVIRKGVLFFLSGGFWSMLGLTLSTFMESKYIAYASPFIVYYLLLITYERYLTNLFIISPKEWLLPSDKWLYGDLAVILLIIEISILLFLIFAINVSRRLRYL